MLRTYAPQAHFSENWGYVSLAPIVGGNLFSLAFGRDVDRHSSPASLVAKAIECIDGRECYISTIHLTTAAACMAFGLSIVACLRDWKRRSQ